MPAPLNGDTWMMVRAGKPEKILTRTSGAPTIAYYRSNRQNVAQMGPINANEYITSRLGVELGLPVAKIEFIRHDGILGTISFLVAVDAQTWSTFPFRNGFEPYLSKLQQVAEMIVFDTWTHNEDRNHENLMCVKNAYTNKYDLYFIDNTETLYGRAKPGNRTNGQFSPDGVIKIDEFRPLLTKGFAFFEPSIAKIESLPETAIKAIVDEVPPEFIVEEERNFIYDFLVARKAALRSNFQQFCDARHP